LKRNLKGEARLATVDINNEEDMTTPLLSRGVTIPDPIHIGCYAKRPELGPRILFFSGGSALNGVARELKNYTHNSIHFVSPYDSGGSSAVLRQFFAMPAVGDLRSRLMALADDSVLGHPEILRLFNYRFAKLADNGVLKRRLEAMVVGEDHLTSEIINPMRSLICNHLGYFLEKMPAAFDLRGANIGNLILVGGYIHHHRELDAIIHLFSELIRVRGVVRAISDDNYHLVAELANGRQIIGQHRLTGKEAPAITSPIVKLGLSARLHSVEPVDSQLKQHNRRLIGSAELICYPPGSYYSSLAANLLPDGVSESIAENPCPKVYIPNLGHDPEQFGMTINDQVDTLLARLQGQFATPVAVSRILNVILYDSRQGLHSGQLDIKRYTKMGIQVIDTPLINPARPEVYDNNQLVQGLLSLT
jgi:CofD-related protein of GAK system